MTDLAVIPPGANYELLRQEGLEHLRALAGELWTDHNSHDPGITALEAFCYALSDLDYRTAFSIPDLLAPDPNAPGCADDDGLYPAHEILPNAPLTVLDYRALLLAVGGVRNGWLHIETEHGPRLFRTTDPDDTLSLTALTEGTAAQRAGFFVQGLYRVLLELEVHPEFGALGERSREVRIDFNPANPIPLTRSLRGVTVRIDLRGDGPFPDPERVSVALDPAAPVVSADPPGTRPRDEGKLWRGGVTIESLEEPKQTTTWVAHIEIVDARPRGDRPAIEVSADALGDALLDAVGHEGLIVLFLRKQAEVARIHREVSCALHAHRNLCEDFVAVGNVPTAAFAVCVDVHVSDETDIELLYARIALALEEYLNPPLRRYSLTELLADGLTTEEIYAGPYIDRTVQCGGGSALDQPGFVRPEELAATELREVVYASDIINLLMDLEGVVTLEHLILLGPHRTTGEPLAAAERWELAVPTGHQPNLARESSRIVFYKNGIPYTAKDTESRETLDYLRAIRLSEAAVVPGETLPLPLGRFRNPGAYYPVQNDFPANYGIGRERLPPDASPQREAQAQQMKAYLQVFEQVLADYLMQLAGVGRLLSPTKTLDSAYPSRFLAPPLLTPIDDAAPRDDAALLELYLSPAATEQAAEDGTLYTRTEDFPQQRHRILDHLLARFAEAAPAAVTEVDDKIDLLADLPRVGRNRGQAFNYRPNDPAQLWGTADNIDGASRRISRLLGIDDLSRRDLHCEWVETMLLRTRDTGTGWTVYLSDPADSAAEPLLSTSAGTLDQSAAVELAAALGSRVGIPAAYAITEDAGAFELSLTAGAGGPGLVHRDTFESRSSAQNRIRALIALYARTLRDFALCGSEVSEEGESDGKDVEGFYLIEHVLLRPLTEAPAGDEALLRVCTPEGATPCPHEDPYSFRVSVVFPYWTGRFIDLNFRDQLERTVRSELPAHVHARICWVDNPQLRQLGEHWRAFLIEKPDPQPDPNTFPDALANLVATLDSLVTIYPEATLHDCEEDGGDAPVQLGRTRLGRF